MKNYIDIFPKLTRISRAGWDERRIIGSFSFYDGSMIMVSSRVQVFKIFKWMSTRPDTFKMTFSNVLEIVLKIVRWSSVEATIGGLKQWPWPLCMGLDCVLLLAGWCILTKLSKKLLMNHLAVYLVQLLSVLFYKLVISCCIALYCDSLQRLVSMCKHKLGSLGLVINVKKSVYTRIGPHCNIPCCDISTIIGTSLQWVDTVRCLCVYIIRSHTFKFCINNSKQSFIEHSTHFVKITKTATEEVTLSMIKTKCIRLFMFLDDMPYNTTLA